MMIHNWAEILLSYFLQDLVLVSGRGCDRQLKVNENYPNLFNLRRIICKV